MLLARDEAPLATSREAFRKEVSRLKGVGREGEILRAGPKGMVVALELLTTYTPGVPVVDDRSGLIGFISEFDVLRALEAGKLDGQWSKKRAMLHKSRMILREAGTSIACPDSLEGEQSFEITVPLKSVKRDCDRAAQSNPAQHPRSRLRAGQTRGTYAH